jgi:hypothetical protein
VRVRPAPTDAQSNRAPEPLRLRPAPGQYPPRLSCLLARVAKGSRQGQTQPNHYLATKPNPEQVHPPPTPRHGTRTRRAPRLPRLAYNFPRLVSPSLLSSRLASFAAAPGPQPLRAPEYSIPFLRGESNRFNTVRASRVGRGRGYKPRARRRG